MKLMMGMGMMMMPLLSPSLLRKHTSRTRYYGRSARLRSAALNLQVLCSSTIRLSESIDAYKGLP